MRFTHNATGLNLTMSWPKWKLGRGLNYLVELAAGSSVLQLKDVRFVEALRLTDALDVKGEGTIIKVALAKSTAGLDRLEVCYCRNGSATKTNPFVAPTRKL
ncbi:MULTISPECIES: hypothetical protein [unclassified Methylobacterium]|uniref:hypothetical protein n=1 Tax=unclassified Methylobacterium TaxID=2615210 RepID=UPI0011C1F298|nr:MULTISPECIES: hypothetical protein [unclassified Methylobacterium]MCJ2039768.1 hypothetical protein [Methylobacterium sp. J-059]MCJ2096674.1 hypothetical protein [Methylobacterium sp. J-072]MCJ2118420.1 hypothetical protein [Methylobacterium sp. J-001]QEE41593.1 hypothetical protein FVA80_24250 [Methylobacterium sp. WL1]TXN57229.1 hypothetical protein FV241_11990 [Methylobacterium sp. WL2]